MAQLPYKLFANYPDPMYHSDKRVYIESIETINPSKEYGYHTVDFPNGYPRRFIIPVSQIIANVVAKNIKTIEELKAEAYLAMKKFLTKYWHVTQRSNGAVEETRYMCSGIYEVRQDSEEWSRVNTPHDWVVLSHWRVTMSITEETIALSPLVV